jgi:hypothetical protein
VYDKTNPFVIDWVERDGKGSWFGFGPSARKARKKIANPRLMEKLMLRLRGEEDIVKDAYGEARRMRKSSKKDDGGEKDELEWLKGRTVRLILRIRSPCSYVQLPLLALGRPLGRLYRPLPSP